MRALQVNAGAIMIATLLVNEGKTIQDFLSFFQRATSTSLPEIDEALYQVSCDELSRGGGPIDGSEIGKFQIDIM